MRLELAIFHLSCLWHFK